MSCKYFDGRYYDESNTCDHKDWEAAGHKSEEYGLIQYSAYEAYCRKCDRFVNILTGHFYPDEIMGRASVSRRASGTWETSI